MNANLRLKFSLIGFVWAIVFLWSLGTPFGGVADEPQYLRNGIYYTLNLTSPSQMNIQENTSTYIDNAACFAFRPEANAKCQKHSSSSASVSAFPPDYFKLFPVPRLWFLLTAWPAILVHGELGVELAKYFAATVSLVAISLGILLWRRSNSHLVMGTILALCPLSVSVIAGYNPNNIEIGGSIAIALLLFGQPTFKERRKFEAGWWLSFAFICFITASAKALSGNLVIFAALIYLTQKYLINRQSSSGNSFRFKAISTKDIYIFAFSIVITLYSYFSSLAVIRAGQLGTKNTPLYHQYWASSMRFLALSEHYGMEFAGIFGWRDTYPAPWMKFIWII